MPYRRIPAASSKPDQFVALRRLTPRDRLLLSWLAEHYLLSTNQIARALFSSVKTAQMRLTILHRIDALSRFAFAGPAGGAQPYLYTLGPLGLRLHPTTYNDPDNAAAKPPRSNKERVERIIASPTRDHLLGVNQFFVDLHAHTRVNPAARLARWWSEQHATGAYASAGIRPDGHGVWTVGDTSVGFFLEHDNGTENLARVITKLHAYERLTEFGPRYPMLLWVPNRRREANLLDALAGARTRTPVATAAQNPDPAGPVWTLASDPDRPRRLDELPSDHGPRGATNPQRFTDPADGTHDESDDG